MKEETSSFCELYGDSIRNRILERLLENQGLDFAAGDLAKEVGISRPKAYEWINEFEAKGLVKKSRTVGNTQLYLLNKENNLAKLLIQSFKACLRQTAETHSEFERPIAARYGRRQSISYVKEK